MNFGLKFKRSKAPRSAARSSSSGLQVLLADYSEKIVLGVVAAVVLLLIFRGYRKDGLAPDKTPERLEETLRMAKSNIDRNTWSEVVKTRYPEKDQFEARATLDTVAIKTPDYPLPVPFHPLLAKPKKLRTDPELLPVVDLRALPGFGPLALKATGGIESTRGPRLLDFRTDKPADERPLPDGWAQSLPGHTATARDANLKGVFFIALTGLVPVKQQMQHYIEAFRDTEGIVPDRDRPNYVSFEVQRAEVGPDGTPGSWEKLDTAQAMTSEIESWDTPIDDLTAAVHIEEQLAMPIPPLVNRDVKPWAMHPRLPSEKDWERREAQESNTEEGSHGGIGRFSRLAEERPSAHEAGRHGASGGDEEMPSETLGGFDPALIPKVDHLLFRFFDFHVQPGKAYQYRVRLLLDDPNDPSPEASRNKPPDSTLHVDVLVRLSTPQEQPHIRKTDWSETVGPLRVPDGTRVFAGPVEQPPRTAVGTAAAHVELPRPGQEPKASLMIVGWDLAQALDIPVETLASRGTLLNRIGDIEVPDLVRWVVRKLTDQQVQSNRLVLDVEGGDTLTTNSRDEDLKAPGSVLLLEPDGSLVVRHELHDADSYRRFRLPPPDVQEEKKHASDRDEKGKGRPGARERGGRRSEEE